MKRPLSIRTKIALTFIGMLVLLAFLLAFVMPAAIYLNTRSLIAESTAQPTGQAWERIFEDLQVSEYLFQQQGKDLAQGVQLAFAGGQPGAWLEQPGRHRRQLESWLEKKSRNSDSVCCLWWIGRGAPWRTPLLMEESIPAAERKEFEHFVVEATDHITDMVQEILDYSREEERSLDLQPQRLSDFLNDLEPRLRREFEQPGVAVSLKVIQDATVALDRHAMERVIHNLAANARDALGKEGQFILEADREKGQAVLRVKDTGPGLPDAIRDHLFVPFVTHGKAHGTGLGLTHLQTVCGKARRADRNGLRTGCGNHDHPKIAYIYLLHLYA